VRSESGASWLELKSQLGHVFYVGKSLKLFVPLLSQLQNEENNSTYSMRCCKELQMECSYSKCHMLAGILLFIYFLAALGFELSTSHLLGRCSTSPLPRIIVIIPFPYFPKESPVQTGFLAPSRFGSLV
jgi:hypothetical protein